MYSEDTPLHSPLFSLYLQVIVPCLPDNSRYLLMAILGLLLIAGGVWLTVDEGSAEEVAQSFLNATNFDESVKDIPNLDKALQEVVTHSYFNYALIGMGVITFLVALFGFQGAKKESTCLLTTYSICLMLIIVLSVTA